MNYIHIFNTCVATFIIGWLLVSQIGQNKTLEQLNNRITELEKKQ